jgi:hypothetical protein
VDREIGATDDQRLLQVAGLALTAAVWVLGVVPPPPRGLSVEYLASYTGLMAGMVALELTLPPRSASARRRSAWLGAELAVSFLVVQTSLSSTSSGAGTGAVGGRT